MEQALRLLRQNRSFRDLRKALAGRRVKAGGVTAGAVSLTAAALALAENREILLAVPHRETAEDLHENIRAFIPSAALLEPPEALVSFEQEQAPATDRARIRLFQRYLPGEENRPRVVVACAGALVEGAPAREDLASRVLRFEVGARPGMRAVVERLVKAGFSREHEAESPWQFALRGGILDVFSPGEDFPVRVEFFGDEVASIRSVNPATALSMRKMDSAVIALPPRSRADKTPFTAHLRDDAVVILWEPTDIQRAAQAHAARAGGASTIGWEHLWKSLDAFTLVEATAFHFADKSALSFETRAFSVASHEVEKIVDEFRDFCLDVKRTFVFCVNEAEKARMEELFRRPAGAPPLFKAALGRFNHSFYFADGSLAVIGHQDIFHRYKRTRRLRPSVPSRPVASVVELSPGDYVVHADHGIARYRGTRIMEKDGVRREYLVLSFARNTRLLVPASHMDLVSRYIGPSDSPPKLNAIGSRVWKARKARVARAVRELAAELLRLQAVRTSKRGIAYDFSSHLQSQFEAEFMYEETDDQLGAMRDIKRDMESPRPMDRLLCGDVGFGKTELAIRAAFAAVNAEKQVAMLVPTTILAEQHYRTFSERMADYPVFIEVLSRLRPRADQRKTIERLRRHEADIVIGTHRLIQRDVVFADLGLVIIDEEQRFGVEAKERLKRLRETVDVLTLTATPIPRTLHMALVGLRDISVLETPPLGRQAVSTFVGALSPERLREVILRELDRDGQAFFVHNRVHSIENAAARLRSIVPEARITVAHGRMDEDMLASRMIDFIERKYDVLVATTIIESGLDIPNVNTLIVDQADRFGLADLHQLRGRVGRYKRRAYAYFLLDESRPLSPEASRRLQAIEHFSELGAGFRIATRDMELRGVGNVLGREQSGHVATVGYELFCRLLSEAVSEVKGQAAARIPECYVELGTSACIPQSYVESPSHRLDLYKRLATVTSIAAIERIEEEIEDRFGPLPDQARQFVLTARLRVLAFENGISMILKKSDHIALQSVRIEEAAHLFEGPGREVRVLDERDAVLFFEDAMPQGTALLERLINILQEAPVGI